MVNVVEGSPHFWFSKPKTKQIQLKLTKPRTKANYPSSCSATTAPLVAGSSMVNVIKGSAGQGQVGLSTFFVTGHFHFSKDLEMPRT